MSTLLPRITNSPRAPRARRGARARSGALAGLIGLTLGLGTGCGEVDSLPDDDTSAPKAIEVTTRVVVRGLDADPRVTIDELTLRAGTLHFEAMTTRAHAGSDPFTMRFVATPDGSTVTVATFDEMVPATYHARMEIVASYADALPAVGARGTWNAAASGGEDHDEPTPLPWSPGETPSVPFEFESMEPFRIELGMVTLEPGTDSYDLTVVIDLDLDRRLQRAIDGELLDALRSDPSHPAFGLGSAPIDAPPTATFHLDRVTNLGERTLPLAQATLIPRR